MRTPLQLDQLRQQAVTLRRQGKSRRQIKEALGFISNSTLGPCPQGPLPKDRRLGGRKHGEIAICRFIAP